MAHLTSDHIDYITKDITYRGIVVDGVREELIDHICDGVESEMAKGTRFIDAYHKVLHAFGHNAGLRDTQKNILQSKNQTPRLMIRNYITIAFRTLNKHRFYSLINIAGLAIGIASCLVIVLFVLDELGYDKHHEKSSRVFRIDAEIKFGGNHLVMAHAPAPLAETLVQEYPEVETAVRFRQRGSFLVKTTRVCRQFQRKQCHLYRQHIFQNFYGASAGRGCTDRVKRTQQHCH